jgi:hypothetical protein
LQSHTPTGIQLDTQLQQNALQQIVFKQPQQNNKQEKQQSAALNIRLATTGSSNHQTASKYVRRRATSDSQEYCTGEDLLATVEKEDFDRFETTADLCIDDDFGCDNDQW